jgi:hypothetical protein
LVNKLRAKHLETYDRLGIPIADAGPLDFSDRLKVRRLKLDMELLTGREGRRS